MKAKRPIVTLHMVSSLDGYIARHDDSVSWLEGPGPVSEAGVAEDSAEVEKVLETIDCYVLGSRTCGHALRVARTRGGMRSRPAISSGARTSHPPGGAG